MNDFKAKDIVRIKQGLEKNTGVVNRIDGESVNVFVTQDNPSGLGIWFNYRELKRISSTKRKVKSVYE